MKNTIYEKQLQVNSCRIDVTAHMGITDAMGLIQDMISEQTGRMGIDDFSIKNKSGAFWVMNKVRLKLFKMPCWKDTVKLTSCMIQPTGVQCRWDFLAADEQGTPFWTGRTELCLLDFETHRIRRVNSTCFPLDLDFCEANTMKFDKFKPTTESGEYMYSKVIRATDLDIVCHTNNVQYNTFALDTFTADELKAMEITDYQIDFVSESHEGDRIDLYREKTEDGYTVIGIHPDDGKMIFKTKIVGKRHETV